MSPLVLDVLPWLGLRDPFSVLSHVLGAILSVAALAALLRQARRGGLPARARRSRWLYGLSLVLAFAASALFHAPAEESVLYKKLDHAAIFLLIVGTGTALYESVGTAWARRLVVALWVVSAAALVVKMTVWPMPLWLTASVYLGVALPALAGVPALGRREGAPPLGLLVGGAGVLIAGAAVFAAEWPVLWPGVIEGHEVFHVMVLLGVAMHFYYIYRHGPTLYACNRPSVDYVYTAPLVAAD